MALCGWGARDFSELDVVYLYVIMYHSLSMYGPLAREASRAQVPALPRRSAEAKMPCSRVSCPGLRF